MDERKAIVLVVEDIPQVRATAVSILTGFGCKVFDCYNGEEALRLLREHPEIEVLFTDVRMPGMDGLELSETARAMRPDLKIVLTSGYVGEEELPGELPFLRKPWRAEEVTAAVADAIR